LANIIYLHAEEKIVEFHLHFTRIRLLFFLTVGEILKVRPFDDGGPWKEFCPKNVFREIFFFQWRKKRAIRLYTFALVTYLETNAKEQFFYNHKCFQFYWIGFPRKNIERIVSNSLTFFFCLKIENYFQICICFDQLTKYWNYFFTYSNYFKTCHWIKVAHERVVSIKHVVCLCLMCATLVIIGIL